MIGVVGGGIVSLMFYGLLVVTRAALGQPALGARLAWMDRYLLPLRIVIRLFGS